MGWCLTLKTLQREWAAFLWRIRVPRLWRTGVCRSSCKRAIPLVHHADTLDGLTWRRRWRIKVGVLVLPQTG